VIGESGAQVADGLILGEFADGDQPSAGAVQNGTAEPGSDHSAAGRCVRRPQSLQIRSRGQVIENNQPSPRCAGEPRMKARRILFRAGARCGSDVQVGGSLGVAGENGLPSASRDPNQKIQLVIAPEPFGKMDRQVAFCRPHRARTAATLPLRSEPCRFRLGRLHRPDRLPIGSGTKRPAAARSDSFGPGDRGSSSEKVVLRAVVTASTSCAQRASTPHCVGSGGRRGSGGRGSGGGVVVTRRPARQQVRPKTRVERRISGGGRVRTVRPLAGVRDPNAGPAYGTRRNGWQGDGGSLTSRRRVWWAPEPTEGHRDLPESPVIPGRRAGRPVARGWPTTR